MLSSVQKNYICPASEAIDTQVPYYIGYSYETSRHVASQLSEGINSVMGYVKSSRLGHVGYSVYSSASNLVSTYITYRSSLVSLHNVWNFVRSRALNFAIVLTITQIVRTNIRDPIQNQAQRLNHLALNSGLLALQSGARYLFHFIDGGVNKFYKIMYFPYEIIYASAFKALPTAYHVLVSKKTYMAILFYLTNKKVYENFCSNFDSLKPNNLIHFKNRTMPVSSAFSRNINIGMIEAKYNNKGMCASKAS